LFYRSRHKVQQASFNQPRRIHTIEIRAERIRRTDFLTSALGALAIPELDSAPAQSTYLLLPLYQSGVRLSVGKNVHKHLPL
jgi:hypothetical protein